MSTSRAPVIISGFTGPVPGRGFSAPSSGSGPPPSADDILDEASNPILDEAGNPIMDEG